MQREHLVIFCYCDIAAQVHGKGFPISQLAKRLRTGIGWTPTNIMLTAFGPIAESPWGKKYPVIAQSWRRNWSEVIPFFAFPNDVRRIIYTTNSIESLNAKLRRAVRTRGHFPPTRVP